MTIDMDLYDSATGESLKSIKTVDLASTKEGERVQMLFTQSKRGRIVQLRHGIARIHYFLDEAYSHKMMDEDSTRFGFPPGELYLTAKRHAPPLNTEADGFTRYRRKQIAELRPYRPGEKLEGVSVSEVDSTAGSPKDGDMIARNPANHDDKWLVAAKYFIDNFEPL